MKWRKRRSSDEYQVFPFRLDGEFRTGAFVECALPPVGEVAEGIDQFFAMQTVCSEVDDGYLLSGMAWEGAGTPAGDEDAVIGIGTYIGSGAEIVDEQADISQGMVFTLARGTDDGDAAFILRQQKLTALVWSLVSWSLMRCRICPNFRRFSSLRESPSPMITSGVWPRRMYSSAPPSQQTT